MEEAQEEKKKELLEIELERVSTALKHSESENTRLNDEILLAKEKLEETEKKYEDLELSHKKLQVEADVSAAIQQELAVSRSQVVDLERRISSKEAFTLELTHKLDQKHYFSNDIRLWLKVEAELEDIKLRLEDAAHARESVLEAEVERLSQGLADVMKEAEFFTSRVDNMEDICTVNDKNTMNALEYFDRRESLLSETLMENDELKDKITQLKEELNQTHSRHSSDEVEPVSSSSNEAEAGSSSSDEETEAGSCSSDEAEAVTSSSDEAVSSSSDEAEAVSFSSDEAEAVTSSSDEEESVSSSSDEEEEAVDEWNGFWKYVFLIISVNETD